MYGATKKKNLDRLLGIENATMMMMMIEMKLMQYIYLKLKLLKRHRNRDIKLKNCIQTRKKFHTVLLMMMKVNPMRFICFSGILNNNHHHLCSKKTQHTTQILQFQFQQIKKKQTNKQKTS